MCIYDQSLNLTKYLLDLAKSLFLKMCLKQYFESIKIFLITNIVLYLWTKDHVEYCYNNRDGLLLLIEPIFVMLCFLNIFL